MVPARDNQYTEGGLSSFWYPHGFWTSTPENLKKSKNRGPEKGKEVPKFGTPPNFSLSGFGGSLI